MSLSSSTRDNVVLNQPFIFGSVPKCGTHLLMNIMTRIVGNNNVFGFSEESKTALINDHYLNEHDKLMNKIYFGHFWYSDQLYSKLQQIPKIILIRDPRDYVLSQAHFWNNFKGKENDVDVYFQKLNNEERITAAILGVKKNSGILHSVYDMFINCGVKWIDSKCMVVRYEDLIGSTPPRVEEKSINVIKSIIKFIGIDNDYNYDNLEDDIFCGSDPITSLTFRQGKTNRWKEEFNSTHVQQFKITAPNLVSSLGYENNEDWNLNKTVQTYDNVSIKSITKLPFKIDQIINRCEELNKMQTSLEMKYLINIWSLDHLMEISDYENSLIMLNYLLEKESNNGYWNYLKGFCLHILNRDLDMALRYYDLAQMNGFDEFWIRYNRGCLYMKLGKNKSAKSDFEKALILQPDFDQIHDLLKNLTE